ncbi:hypothetical protein HDE_09156 [Halotydeus destructor]|nr:hypothetical protein HDE_09156 [Halotydeus destructor]
MISVLSTKWTILSYITIIYTIRAAYWSVSYCLRKPTFVDYWTKSVTTTHNLTGYECADSALCYHGQCQEIGSDKKALREEFDIDGIEITIMDGIYPYYDASSKGDPFMDIYVDDKFYVKTAALRNTDTPNFNYKFRVENIRSDSRIRFDIWDRNSLSWDKLIGSIAIVVGDIYYDKIDCKPSPYPYGHKGGFFRIRVCLDNSRD